MTGFRRFCCWEGLTRDSAENAWRLTQQTRVQHVVDDVARASTCHHMHALHAAAAAAAAPTYAVVAATVAAAAAHAAAAATDAARSVDAVSPRDSCRAGTSPGPGPTHAARATGTTA
jgi:glycine cleavage system pyridoxal-binding protein P